MLRSSIRIFISIGSRIAREEEERKNRGMKFVENRMLKKNTSPKSFSKSIKIEM